MITKINSRTPEEIKKGLALCKRAKGDSCDRCPYQMKPLEINAMCIRALENDALAYVQQLERSWDELFEKAKRLEAERDAALAAQSKWISAKERLPEPFHSVLVYMPGENPLPPVHEGYITDDRHWFSAHYVREFDEVTHWTPLPEPPEAKEL